MKKSDINVLIVDDDQTVGRTLSEVINRAGYKATFATRADEALNLVRLKQIHAAVIDCMLPAMNGIALVEELRKTRFHKNAVVLMSGIFRDKSFESEALSKTGAHSFLQKPFGPTDLLNALKPIFDSLVEEKQWSLSTILVRQMESTRDRVKLIEHLEQIRGVELAFVLSILMEAKLSGNINLVTDTAIYGLKLQVGRLASVDSEDADEVVVRFLIDTGYLTQEDWEEFSKRESKKFPLHKLLATGYISPHAALQAQKDQVLSDLRRILKVDKVNLSFSNDRSPELSAEGLDLAEIFVELTETMDALLKEDFLREFFAESMAAPIRNLEAFNQSNPVWNMPIVGRMKGHLATIKDKTLDGLVKQMPGHENDVLKAVYLLVMFRQILFLDAEKLRAFESEAKRREIAYEAIKGKNPFDVFIYFGSSPKATPAEVGNIFKEFVRSNHPDKLAPDSPQALRDVTNSIFALVSSAYDTLSDTTKREAYQQKAQQELAAKQMQADSLAQEGAELIRRGAYIKAEEKLTTSMQMSNNGETFALLLWSRIKQTGKIQKADLPKLQKQLDEILTKNRTSARVHMAIGLVRAASGDPQASASFEKALSISPNFVEARREINALQSAAKENTGKSAASDLLTGDITNIVSQLFKKKKAK